MPIRSIEGLPIRDAGKSVKIAVSKRAATQQDGRLDPAGCPFARACKAALGVTKVFVYRKRAYVKSGDHYKRFIIPEALHTEIVSYDRGGGFQAGEFTLKKPTVSQQLGAHRERDQNRKTGPKARRESYHILDGVRESPTERK